MKIIDNTSLLLGDDPKQVVTFGEQTNCVAFAVGEATLGALHQSAAPGIWYGVADPAEGRKAIRRSERATSQCECGLQRKAIRVIQPLTVAHEENRLRPTDTVAPR